MWTTGEAAGTAAALCVRADSQPRTLIYRCPQRPVRPQGVREPERITELEGATLPSGKTVKEFYEGTMADCREYWRKRGEHVKDEDTGNVSATCDSTGTPQSPRGGPDGPCVEPSRCPTSRPCWTRPHRPIPERARGCLVKITCIETLQCRTYPNLVWIQIHTDAGLIGLGETFYGPDAVATYVHETAAPYLLGRDPTAIQLHHSASGSDDVRLPWGPRRVGAPPSTSPSGTSSGQSVGLRSTGASVARCGTGFGRTTRAPATGTTPTEPHGPAGAFRKAGGSENSRPLRDLAAWQNEDRAADLARSLLDMGINAMKIWPFDQFADEDERPAHQPGAARPGRATVLADSRGGRESDGHCGRAPLALNLPSPLRIASGPGGCATDVDRGSRPYGQPRRPGGVCD